MLLHQFHKQESVVVLRQFKGQTICLGIASVQDGQQIVEHADDDMVAVGYRLAQFAADFLQQPFVFRQFVGCCHEVWWRVGLLAVLQAIDKELVGNKRTHEVVAEDKEIVVEGIFVNVPFLLLVGLQDEHHAIAQFYLLVAQQQIAIGLTEEEHLEKIGLEHGVFRQHAPPLTAMGGVDKEIYTTFRLAERHLYEPVCCFCHTSLYDFGCEGTKKA